MTREVFDDLGGAFNGQEGRKKLFWHLVSELSVSVFVETGTYRGATTAYVAERFRGPIYTCEVDPRYFAAAQQRLSGLPNVQLMLEDSREYLKQLITSGVLSDRSLLVYLDAHWQWDLPISGELETLLGVPLSGAVIIDDFQVPGDPSYGFDDYGPGKKLSLELIHPFRDKISEVYFPSLRGSDETGRRRGAVIIPLGAHARTILSRSELLTGSSLE